jgi:predicted adenine nucleotide alpha hydrolase (AANH) superfamily ATPase
MKLLYHCCCAPCATACVDHLCSDGLEPDLFWYNRNIHPFIEYKNRLQALVQCAEAKNLRLETSDEYGLKFFIRTVFHKMENGPAADKGRCELCYRIRLEKTAATAAEKGCGTFSTSLLASPYQNHEEIRRTGEEAAAKYDVDCLYRDFRPRFRGGQDRARALGLYMQKYCGCIFSEEERYLKQ